MENCLKSPTIEQEHAKPATEKVELAFKAASNAKEKVVLFKCTKWDLACISKFKKPAMFVKEKAKSWNKAKSAKRVWERRF